MGHCMVKCSLCSVQQVWWSLHWGLRQGWSGSLWGLRFCRFVEISKGGGSTRPPQRTEPFKCMSGQPWHCHWPRQGQMQPLQCAAGVVGPALGLEAGLGRWFMRAAGLPVSEDFQRRRQHLVSTAHRALQVWKWPAVVMPWGTAMSNAASAVCIRFCGDCTGEEGCSRAGQQVVCGRCKFAGLWRFLKEEAALGNQSTKTPTTSQ